MTNAASNQSDLMAGELPFMFTPESARSHILSLGYGADSVTRLAEAGSEGSSHQLHALAYIATQNGPMDLNAVYRQLYPGQKRVETTADVEARLAADEADGRGEWERFAKGK